MGTPRWYVQLDDARSDSEEPRTNVLVAEALGMRPRQDVRDTLSAYIRGEAGDRPSAEGVRIDRMHRALLRRHGVDPLRFLRARHLGLGFSVLVAHGGDWADTSVISDDLAPRLTGVTWIGPGVRHDTQGPSSAFVTVDVRVHGALPETVADAVVGRPLSMLIPHGLDVDPLVTGFERLGGQTIVGVGDNDFVAIDDA